MANELEAARKRLNSSIFDLKNAIEDAANSTAAEWLGLSGTIRSLGQHLVAEVISLSNDLRKLALVVHYAEDVRLQADSWSGVKQRASELKAKLSDHETGIRAYNHFEGSAGRAYREAVGMQVGAVKGMADGAQQVSGMLNTVASALDTACNSAAAATTAAGVAVAGVIWGAAPASIVGALNGAITTVRGASRFIQQAEVGLVTVSNTQSGQAKALTALLDAQGSWPKPGI
jgi:hypothetical protein